ncbi:MAG TPA: hypothetical protein DCR97_08865 [Deltaproteobacteria bacterium]|nr:hypothetical protein [Deltaproteobacteria bacterium]
MPAPVINVSQLLTFYFVGKEGNVTAAAEKLCITQPAVTKQIRALEDTFRVKLIHVKRRKIYLTTDGQRLFNYAEEIYHASVNAESFLRSRRNASLRVGVSSSLTAYLTPILESLKESEPFLFLNVKEGASVEIIQELLEFQHDVCLVPSPYKITDELGAIRIPKAEKMVLVTSPVGPFAAKESISWKDLQGCPFILHREGSILRQLILDHFKERNIDVRVAANIDSIPLMKSLVEKGKGLALMLPSAVKEEVNAGRLKVLPVSDGGFWLNIDVVMQKEMSSSPACRAFLRLLESHIEQEI